MSEVQLDDLRRELAALADTLREIRAILHAHDAIFADLLTYARRAVGEVPAPD